MMGPQESTPTLEGSALAARDHQQTTLLTTGRGEEDHGVTTAANQDILEKIAGKFMANPLIGSPLDQQMTR